LKDHDFELMYYSKKANVVTNVLNRKKIHVVGMMVKELEMLEKS